ncbi:hypothetical protein [Shewanella sp. SM32]|uniref:hypothetical protein n=1 Tax=Shewanella sp. SM32 TaxID=2912796 RepID=UPI0021D95C4C|nr:hypothetical protein [Shewanella sp. SM32]MCU8069137.1 hypothetical protein [Shewanella sp. SM32]
MNTMYDSDIIITPKEQLFIVRLRSSLHIVRSFVWKGLDVPISVVIGISASFLLGSGFARRHSLLCLSDV